MSLARLGPVPQVPGTCFLETAHKAPPQGNFPLNRLAQQFCGKPLLGRIVFLTIFEAVLALPTIGFPQSEQYFGIRVIDAHTRRGVPLVELRTVHEVSYWTDSAGWVAVGDPELMNREVYFHVRSPGYTLPADGFGFRGVRLPVRAGQKATISLQRQNLAERLYRITGAGIYRDSTLVGDKEAFNTPLVRADVAGQDSVQSAVYRGKIYWFWGDTNRLSYPLGNFRTTGAVAPLPGQEGFDPARGVPLKYFTGPDERCKNMCPFEPPEGMIWIDGLVVLLESNDEAKLIAHYARMKSLEEMLEHGLAVFDPDQSVFRTWVRFPLSVRGRVLQGHPFRHREGEMEYVYCGLAVANLRVRATQEAIADPNAYEVWTCLAEALPARNSPTHSETPPSSKQSVLPSIERDTQGKAIWRWSHKAPPVDPMLEDRLFKAGRLKPEETYFHPVDVETGQHVLLHSGSVRWNPWRRRWILIAVEQGGNSSFLGEVWYAEAESPVGPWRRTIKILTHDRYSFYNPVHHDFLDQEGGRVIYFEGTYSHTFSGAPLPTPRYDYNQIMYRLDLADPRLKPAQP